MVEWRGPGGGRVDETEERASGTDGPLELFSIRVLLPDGGRCPDCHLEGRNRHWRDGD